MNDQFFIQILYQISFVSMYSKYILNQQQIKIKSIIRQIESPFIFCLASNQLIILFLIIFYYITSLILVQPLFIITEFVLWLSLVSFILSEPLSYFLYFSRECFLDVRECEYLKLGSDGRYIIHLISIRFLQIKRQNFPIKLSLIKQAKCT